MTNEERGEMNRICLAIQQEKDPAKLTALADELNTLLDRAIERKCLACPQSPKASNT